MLREERKKQQQLLKHQSGFFLMQQKTEQLLLPTIYVLGPLKVTLLAGVSCWQILREVISPAPF